MRNRVLFGGGVTPYLPLVATVGWAVLLMLERRMAVEREGELRNA